MYLDGAADRGILLSSAMEKATEAVARALTDMYPNYSDVRANFGKHIVVLYAKGLLYNSVDPNAIEPYIRQWILRAMKTKETYTDDQAFYKACLQTPGATTKKAAIVAAGMTRAWAVGYLNDTETQDLISNPSGYSSTTDDIKVWVTDQVKKAANTTSNSLTVAQYLPYLVPLAAVGVAMWFLLPYRNAGKKIFS